MTYKDVINEMLQEVKNVDNQYIELIAERVHNVCVEEKINQGFNIDLCPYNELPDNVKEYNRVIVRAVLQAMIKIKEDE